MAIRQPDPRRPGARSGAERKHISQHGWLPRMRPFRCRPRGLIHGLAPLGRYTPQEFCVQFGRDRRCAPSHARQFVVPPPPKPPPIPQEEVLKVREAGQGHGGVTRQDLRGVQPTLCADPGKTRVALPVRAPQHGCILL